MPGNESRNNQHLFYLSLSIIAFITIFPFFQTGLGNGDDMQNYMIGMSGFLKANADYYATISGRFYYYLVLPFLCIPFMFDNWFITKLFHFIPILLCIILFARILFHTLRSKEMALLFMFLFFVTMQVSRHTSLLATYPLYFTFSFALILLSFLLLIYYYQTGRWYFLLISVISFAAGLLFYETYLLYLVFMVGAILYYSWKQSKKRSEYLRKAIIHFLPFAAVVAIYLTVYFIFRYYHPSSYPRLKFIAGNFQFSSFFLVIWRLAYTSIPLTVFETNWDLFNAKSELISGFRPIVMDIIVHARVEWLVKGILVVVVGYMILDRLQQIRIYSLLFMVLLSILLIFFPQIPLALSEKYNYFVLVQSDMIGYIPTFFSLFGTVLLITTLFSLFINLLKVNPIAHKGFSVMAVVGLFICSVLTDFTNHTIAKDIRSSNLRLQVMDSYIHSDAFQKLPFNACFYGPDMYETPSYCARSITEQNFSYGDFMKLRGGTRHPFYKNAEEFEQACRQDQLSAYSCTMKQAIKSEDIMMVVARLNPADSAQTLDFTRSDSIVVIYYSPYKIFTVRFNCVPSRIASGIPLMINHIHEEIPFGSSIEFTLSNTQRNQDATVFTLRAAHIDIGSILISNIINPANRIIYL